MVEECCISSVMKRRRVHDDLHAKEQDLHLDLLQSLNEIIECGL